MKILYHHRTASADGQAVHIEELVSALRELGHEVRIVSPTLVSEESMGGEVGWVNRLKRLLPKSIYELLELSYSLVAYRRLERAVHEFQPDILYERYNLYMLAGALIHRRYHLPFILEVNAPLVYERIRHGGLGLPRLARWAEGLVWRDADYVLPVTHVLATHVELYGVAKDRISVIPNGINKAHFSSAPPTDKAKAALGLEGRLVLGFTGFVRDWHGIDKIIRWMSVGQGQIPENAHLLVVGDGPVRAELELLARNLSLSDRVTFTGVVAREQVPCYVAAFDIALQAAVVAYASPLKLFEYLALGKSIVAPNTPNLLEILENERNALLFSPEQEGALGAALDRLCNDEILRKRLGFEALATIDRLELTWLGNAKKVQALANQLISSRQTAQ